MALRAGSPRADRRSGSGPAVAGAGRSGTSGGLSRMTWALAPPKPKELTPITRRPSGLRGRAWVTTRRFHSSSRMRGLSLRTPMVAGKAGGIPLQMADGTGGLLVDGVEECAKALVALLKDPEHARELARRGRERVREHFLLPRLVLNTMGAFTTDTAYRVRPGAIVNSEVGQCTFNFLFIGTDGRRYIGTAGHCILEGSATEVWEPGQGPVARDGAGEEVGRFVFAQLDGLRDFALIEVFDGVEVDPQMCHYGGPTGYAGLAAGPVWLQQSGQGIVLGSTVPGRTHLARQFNNPDSIRFDGAVIFGDSGSPINTEDGLAGGVVVSIGLNTNGPMRATRLLPQVQLAEQALDLELELQTAPQL